uniref:RNA-directed DNA polymerase n=1 Tax=Trichuris muris TaxID=70415 RepID=A0A5S6QP63_TRIMR
MRKLFGTRVVLLKERSKFFGLRQETHQTPMQFANYLRHAAAQCDFDNFDTDAALVVQFVNGISNQAVRVKLLAKGKDLTLDDALTYLQVSEDIQREDANTPRVAMDATSCHAVKTSPPKTVMDRAWESCDRCGKNVHAKGKCPFINFKCFNCGRTGHLSRMCRQSKTDRYAKRQQHVNYRPNRRQKSGYQVKRTETAMLQVVRTGTPNPLTVAVTIDGHLVVMELDTGASVTIANPTLWRRIGSPVLSPPTVRLRSFSGHLVPLKGETTVSVECGGQLKQLCIRVANHAVVNVMGRDWLEVLGGAVSIKNIFKGDASIHCVGNDARLQSILDRFQTLFQPGLGHCTKIKAHLEPKPGAQAVFRKPYPVPFALQEAVEAQLRRYVELGTLTPVDRSDWAAPIVVARKSNNEIRLCADFSTGLNDRLVSDSYPIPPPEDLFQALNGGQSFSKVDLSDAYLQIELDEESKKMVVINTHKGLFQYNRLPFGVKAAPAIFQKAMDAMLTGIPKVAAYLDDIIITGASDEEHLRTLETVLSRLLDYGFRIKREKCKFMEKEVEYLGHIVSAEGLRADPKKTEAIVRMKPPQDLANLRSFLGMVNFYAPFIPHLTDIAAPLYRLLRKEVSWTWKQKESAAFEQIKSMLNSPLLLAHYDPHLPIVLAADASNVGVGAVLYHRLEDGSVRVIAHASKALNEAQRNYAQVEKEALALVYAVKKFHKYLWGRDFILLTDHKPLVSIFGSKKGVPQTAVSRLTRWCVTLMNYTFKIEYRNTKDFGHADGLSRLPLTSKELFNAEFDQKEAAGELMIRQLMEEARREMPVTAAEVAEYTQKDEILRYASTF